MFTVHLASLGHQWTAYNISPHWAYILEIANMHEFVTAPSPGIAGGTGGETNVASLPVHFVHIVR